MPPARRGGRGRSRYFIAQELRRARRSRPTRSSFGRMVVIARAPVCQSGFRIFARSAFAHLFGDGSPRKLGGCLRL